MMKTKTESELLQRLWREDHIRLHGKRELNAAKKLETQRMAEVINGQLRLTEHGRSKLNVERLINNLYPAAYPVYS